MKGDKNWIGIDFGTCYTSAARLNGNSVVMIPVLDAPDTGAVQRPTVAYIAKDGVIKTGYAAEAYRYSDPSRFFSEFKLDIIDDDSLVPDSKATYADFVAAVLSDVREDARRDNNDIPIDNAVITVPVIYTKDGPHWKVMQNAARKAGFKQVELFYEPEAAALYYQHVSGETLGDLTLVYDLGGGTFDPALIECTDDGWKLLQTGRTNGLKFGGLAFDAAVYSWLKSHKEEVSEASGDKSREREYVSLCRDLKHLLSGMESASKPLPHNPNEEVTLKRSEFEQMIDPLIDQTLTCCTDLLISCKKDWIDLSRVLLIGGSTHIPLVRKKVVAYLKNTGASNVEVTQTTIDDKRRVDPICAVAAGAAVFKKRVENTMDAKLYEKKRNELIEILDEILGIEELRDETRVEIQKIRNKSLENNFEIVLVGEFQGGKSTTFNSICDGREISPRGAMVKTSACKISACNLADPDAEEYAQIVWKDERELLLGMIKLIEPHLRKAQPERFGQATQEQMIRHVELSQMMLYGNDSMNVQKVKPLDIHNPDDLELIRTSLSEQWKIYKKDLNSYEQEDLDVLYVSSLVIHFVNSPIIAGLRKTERMSIYEIGKLVTFPMDWTSRWQAGMAEAFHPEEIAFVFLANVRCFIHSPNLARLGCVVTDCPGLFTSPWDTEVAQKAMLDADAILYLFGGSKTLNQSDIRALNEIRKVKMEHKLVYAVNVMGRIRNIRNNVLPENVSKLRAQGFEVSESDIHLYHALLGLCSRNGVPIVKGTLDRHSVDRFVKVAQTIDEDYGDNAKDVWVELSADMIRNLGGIKEPLERLDLDNVKKVAGYSGIDDLFDSIEQAVIKKKAHSILISQGGERASVALALLEGDLKSKEEVAKRTETEFKADVVKAREELERFQKRASETILEIKKPLIAAPLAENFENSVVLSSIPQIAESATEAIVNNLLSFSATFDRLWGKILSKLTSSQSTSLEQALKPLLETSIESTIRPATDGWFQFIKDGESDIYNGTIGALVQSISTELGNDWKKMVDDKKNIDYLTLLGGLELSLPTGAFRDNVKLLEKLNTASLTADVNTGSAIHFAGNVAGFLIGTVVIGVSAIIFAFMPLWVPTIVVMLPGLILASMAGVSVSELIKKGATSKIKVNIENGLRTGFNEPDAKKRLREASLAFVYPMQEVFVNHFQDLLKNQLNLFETRVEESKRLFQEKEQIRREIGSKANELRVKKISPAKSKVDIFLNEVLQVLGEKRVDGQ